MFFDAAFILNKALLFSILVLLGSSLLLLLLAHGLIKFYSDIQESFRSYKKMWDEGKTNPAEKVNFFSKFQSLIIFYEIIGLLVFVLLSLITSESPIQSQYLTIKSSLNLREFILANPTESISVLIGSFSMIIVYLYLFNILGKTKYFLELSDSEVQEKYSAIFWILPFIFLFGGVLFLLIDVMIGKLSTFDTVLFIIGFVNLLTTGFLASNLQDNFFKKVSDSIGLKKGNFNYEFIAKYQETKESFFENFNSDSILIITFLLAGASFIFDFNLFILLMTEYFLLVAHFWSSQLQLLPQNKTTIELVDTDCFQNHLKITDVYVLSESPKGYLLILDKKNQITRIMKESIHKYFAQNG